MMVKDPMCHLCKFGRKISDMFDTSSVHKLQKQSFSFSTDLSPAELGLPSFAVQRPMSTALRRNCRGWRQQS
jgi:hypothetical protein